MPADENGQKQHGYSNIFNINFYSNCEEDDDGTIDATESRLARLRETVLAKSSGRRKAWIMIPQSAYSLPAYKNCEIVQVPGLTFLPLPSSFLYPKNSSIATLVRYQKNKMREAGIFPGDGSAVWNYYPRETDCSRLKTANLSTTGCVKRAVAGITHLLIENNAPQSK